MALRSCPVSTRASEDLLRAIVAGFSGGGGETDMGAGGAPVIAGAGNPGSAAGFGGGGSGGNGGNGGGTGAVGGFIIEEYS